MVGKWRTSVNNYTYTPADGDEVTCELTSEVTCPSASPAISNTVVMSVLTDITPTVSISTTATSICDGESLTFNATSTNGGVSPTYQWKVNTQNVGTGITYSYAPINGDVVTCEMLSSITCAATNPVTSNAVPITVNPILTASVTIAADANPVCGIGNTVIITATPINEGTAPIYQWFNGATPIGTDSPVLNYTPSDGDVITVDMSSNAAPCLANTIVTSNSITMTVSPWPQLQMTGMGVPVTDTHDGIDDAGAIDLFTSTGSVNVSFTNFSDLQAATPSNLVKLRRELVSSNNITVVSWSDATYPLTDYSSRSSWNRIFSLINTASTGTSVVRFRVWLDSNNNNVVDGSECAGDWIVYTVTVNPNVPVSVSITADVNPACVGNTVAFTANPTNGGTTPSYQWKVNGGNIGADGPSFSYVPSNGDIVTCVLTSSALLVSGNPATSNTITMTVSPWPQLQMTGMGVPVTDTHDGIDDAGAIDLFTSTGSVNVSFTNFIDLQAATPSNLVKLRRELVSSNNITVVSWSDATYPLTDYSSRSSWNRIFSLINTASTGTSVVRFRVWLDSNNNNVVDGSECAGDWIVYTVTLNPNVPVSVSITADANPACVGNTVAFTANPTNGGTTPSYQWKVNGGNIGADGPSYSYVPSNGDIVTCVLTSSALLVSGNPATSNTITMTVSPWPQLQMTGMGVPVTDTHDGIDDAGAIDLFTSTGSVNVSFTNFSDLQAATPSNLVKLRRELVSSNNITVVSWSDATYPLTDYSSRSSWNRIFSLINTASTGTSVVRFRVWLDSNNNNVVDGSECAGDWIVYTVTLNPNVPVSVSITADVNPTCVGNTVAFTANPTNGGTTPSYQWKVNGGNIGADGPSFSYVPSNGDIVTCVLTSSALLVSGNPATSNTITMTVSPWPQLQMTGMGVPVTDTHDGFDDAGAIDLCTNTGSVNVSFTNFSDLQAATPSNLVKLRRELVSSNNITVVSWYDASYPLTDYSSRSSWNRIFSLINTASTGTSVVRFRVWLDSNNNNVVDGSECAGDWIVYTVTVNPLPAAAGPITGSPTFTEGTSGVDYSIPSDANATSYVWSYSGTGVTINNPGGVTGNSVTLDFASGASEGTLSVYAMNACGNGTSNSLALSIAPAAATPQSLPKSAEAVTSTFDTPQMELGDLKVYPNPFSDRLRFEFSAPESVNARIDLYDMTGRMVKTIFEQAIEGGVNYNAEFKPEATVSGMYIYRMSMGEKVYNGKVVFRK